MAQENSNTGNLIEAVKLNEVLYNTYHADHKSNKIKNDAWENVAKLIGESNGDKAKNKWKNLRDAYIKHLRSNRVGTGPAAKLIDRYKTWPWSEQMSFLRPYLDFIDADTSNEEPDPRRSTYLRRMRRKKLRLRHEEKPEQLNKKTTPQAVDIGTSLPDFDDIDLVFLGYAKTLKKMPKSKQARVKFQIAQIIMESELEDDDSMTDSKDYRLQNQPECILDEEEDWPEME